MSDMLNVATDAIFAITLLTTVVVLWLAYRDLVDRLFALQSARIIELQLEVDKLKRKDSSAPDGHVESRPQVSAPRMLEKQPGQAALPQ